MGLTPCKDQTPLWHFMEALSTLFILYFGLAIKGFQFNNVLLSDNIICQFLPAMSSCRINEGFAVPSKDTSQRQTPLHVKPT